jgi:hypothetical protein
MRNQQGAASKLTPSMFFLRGPFIKGIEDVRGGGGKGCSVLPKER